MQTQSDIINAPVNRPKCVETTAMGAAYLAGLAVGYWASREDVTKTGRSTVIFKLRRLGLRREISRIRGWNKAVKYALRLGKRRGNIKALDGCKKSCYIIIRTDIT